MSERRQTPPSRSSEQSVKGVPYLPQLKAAFTNKSYLLLFLVIGNSIGIYAAMGTVTQQMLCSFGYTTVGSAMFDPLMPVYLHCYPIGITFKWYSQVPSGVKVLTTPCPQFNSVIRTAGRSTAVVKGIKLVRPSILIRDDSVKYVGIALEVINSPIDNELKALVNY